MTRRRTPGKDLAEAGHAQVGMRYRGRAELALIVEHTDYTPDEALAIATQNGLMHWVQALGISRAAVNARDVLLRAAAASGRTSPGEG